MFKIDKSDCKVSDCKIIGLIKMDYLFFISNREDNGAIMQDK